MIAWRVASNSRHLQPQLRSVALSTLDERPLDDPSLTLGERELTDGCGRVSAGCDKEGQGEGGEGDARRTPTQGRDSQNGWSAQERI